LLKRIRFIILSQSKCKLFKKTFTLFTFLFKVYSSWNPWYNHYYYYQTYPQYAYEYYDEELEPYYSNYQATFYPPDRPSRLGDQQNGLSARKRNRVYPEDKNYYEQACPVELIGNYGRTNDGVKDYYDQLALRLREDDKSNPLQQMLEVNPLLLGATAVSGEEYEAVEAKEEEEAEDAEEAEVEEPEEAEEAEEEEEPEEEEAEEAEEPEEEEEGS